MKNYLAIDIGASSGRHILGSVRDGKITLEEVYRFENGQTVRNGHDCWDLGRLVESVKAGIDAALSKGPVESIGIDTWGVDFVLLDKDLRLCSDSVAYRDKRTEGMPEYVDSVIPFEELYAHTGIQKAIFNTVYQLQYLKKSHPEQLESAKTLLMMPDYLSYLQSCREKFDIVFLDPPYAEIFLESALSFSSLPKFTP